MLLRLVFCLILVAFCNADVHIYGTENPGAKALFDKVLYTKNHPSPKNYTIVFKYIGSESSPNITHAKFEVLNTTSVAVIEVDSLKGREKTLVATLNIINATNLRVTGKVYGPSVSLLDAQTLQKFIGIGTDTPKTMTIVYGQNSTQTRNRKVNLGRRQVGDKLISFQMKNVTFAYRFPETEFEYHDNTKHITAIGFSFDTPTAIAFVNSTFIGERGLNVICYDLNSPSFKANMSVYGYDDFDKPSSYKPIIEGSTYRK